MNASPSDSHYQNIYASYDRHDRSSSGMNMAPAHAVDHHSSRQQNDYDYYQHSDDPYYDQTSANYPDEWSDCPHSSQRVSPEAQSQYGGDRQLRSVLKQTRDSRPDIHRAQSSVYGGAEQYDHTYRPELSRRRSVHFSEEELELPPSSAYSNNQYYSQTSYENASHNDHTQESTYKHARRHSVPIENAPKIDYVRKARPKSYPESKPRTKAAVYDQHHSCHHGEVERNYPQSQDGPAYVHPIHNDEHAYPQSERYIQIAAPRPMRAHYYDDGEQQQIVIIVPPCDHTKQTKTSAFMRRVKKVWAAATHDPTIPPPSPPTSPSPEDHHPKQTHTKEGKPLGTRPHLYKSDWNVDYPVNAGEMM